jgi:hypothetical protein
MFGFGSWTCRHMQSVHINLVPLPQVASEVQSVPAKIFLLACEEENGELCNENVMSCSSLMWVLVRVPRCKDYTEHLRLVVAPP